MPTPVEQALITLVPTINALPSDLMDLAQSHAKAANLKPDEEIGRTYACAHLACERYILPILSIWSWTTC
jgi:origin recognition complex subunit 6